LSLIGLGLDVQMPASKSVTKQQEVVKVGSGAWMRQNSDRKKRKKNNAKNKGW
jgi:hypothetical protein